MRYILRQAAPSDLPAIATIYAPYVNETTITFEYETPSAEAFAARYQAVTADFPWLVCEANGAVVGYAYAHRAFARAAYQWNAESSVYLAPEHQRRGIAAALYKAIEAYLRLLGYCRLYASITSGNAASERFHAAAGFIRCSVFPHCGYKHGAWHDVIWYEKQLNECVANPAPPLSFATLPTKTVSAVLFDAAECLTAKRP